MAAHFDDKHVFTRKHIDYLMGSITGKTLGEVDVSHVFDIAKEKPKVTGIAGDVVEQSVLGFPADSRQEPDIIVDGEEVELKTTGLRLSKKDQGLEGKEPMSITAVSVDTIAEETFYTSKFWHKLKKLLIVYYLYDSSKTVPAGEYAGFPVKGYQFHTFSPDEEEMLKNDWQLVHDYIVKVQVESKTREELAEGYAKLSSALRSDLLMIDTAPKYPHPPRFRLKRSVVTFMARKVFGDGLEMLPGSFSSFDELDHRLHDATTLYRGKKLKEVFCLLGLTGKIEAKNAAERMLVAIFGGKGKLNDIDLFVKTGIKVKSMVLSQSGGRTEDMKLCRIDFDELTSCEDYDESLLRDYLGSAFIIAMFRETRGDGSGSKYSFGENEFLGFKRFAFDDQFVEGEAKIVWEECRGLIRDDELREVPVCRKGTTQPIINKSGTIKVALNFPKSREHILFVRGGGSDARNKPECVNGIRMYLQYFWVKGSFMAERLGGEEWI